jgi:hypothetical protein
MANAVDQENPAEGRGVTLRKSAEACGEDLLAQRKGGEV